MVVVDTCIVIDYLKGIKDAIAEFEIHSHIAISRITWIEVLTGATSEKEHAALKIFLSHLHIIELDEAIAEKSIAVRKKYKLRTPDAIIYASAKCYGTKLITRNTKDFKASEPDIHIPYTMTLH